MSDNDSNDVVVVVESTGNVSDSTDGALAQKETRPLMKLFQRLISNDNKQNTILTNAQIVSILLKEFDIDIVTLHELEVDIYLTLVKRFLKDWPKWDEFDQGINTLRKKNAHKSIKKTLESKYIDLKNYLCVQLEAAKPLAQKAVTEMIEENSKRMAKVDTSDVVLEVHCCRKQLNELIHSHPVSSDTENNNIFHLTDLTPTSISVNQVPIESILNWWGLQVTIDCKYLLLVRQTKHQLKHVLVNAKNGPRDLKRELNTNMQYKDLKKQTVILDKQKLIAALYSLLQSQINNTPTHAVLFGVVNVLLKDLESITELKIPGMYRQQMNKYPYYRKLRKQQEMPVPVASNYDLYLEETLDPMFLLNISRVYEGNLDLGVIENPNWLTIECVECKVKFNDNLFDAIKEHYDLYHTNEPDWVCTNCEKTFNMKDLTMNHWDHSC